MGEGADKGMGVDKDQGQGQGLDGCRHASTHRSIRARGAGGMGPIDPGWSPCVCVCVCGI